MKKFLAVAAGLSFVLGNAVYAQTGGGTTGVGGKSKVTQKAPAKVEKVKEDKKKDSGSWDWGNKKKAEAPKAK